MALQLIEFQKQPTEDDKDRTIIQINKKNLDKVLQKCGDLPLCIICICGPSRQGKSFILSHAIRCLHSIESGNSNWMDWDNKDKPLDKGFTWQNGDNPITQGIWIWERPFILKTATGVECAVLLIDTQGTNDEFTSNRDMTTIVGLSLLMSSLTIFNFFTNLQEDILGSLGTYIEYGLLAMDKAASGKPFQQIKFLIRDWNNPSQYPYGKVGGSQFISKKLEVKPNQPETAQKVRTTIPTCFEKLSCFLMPAPGEAALTTDYNGSIGFLNPNFANKLEELITGLVAEEIQTKHVLGNNVTSKELGTYMDMWVEAFNSSTIPSAMSIWGATCLVANDNTLKKAQKVYQDEMKNSLKDKRYLNPDAFKNAQENAKEAASELFDKSKLYGDNSDSFRQYLMDFIAKERIVNEAENELKRHNIIKRVQEEAQQTFEERLGARFQLENDQQFWPEESIATEGDIVKTTVLLEIHAKLTEEKDEDLVEISSSLETLFVDKINSFKVQNLLNQGRAEGWMANLVEGELERFKQEMEQALMELENVDDLKQICEQKTVSILEKYDNCIKPGGNEFHEPYRKKLDHAMSNEWEQIKLKFDLKLTSMATKSEAIIVAIVKEYEGILNQATQDDTMISKTEDTLKVDHQIKLAEYQERFNMVCPFQLAGSQITVLSEDLKKKLDHALEQALGKVMDFQKEMEKNGNDQITNLAERYFDQMKEAVEQHKFLMPEELEEAHGNNYRAAMQSLERCPTLVKAEKMEKLKEKLKTSLENKFKKIAQDNLSRKTNADANMPIIMDIRLNAYKQEMLRIVEGNGCNDKIALKRSSDQAISRQLAEFDVADKPGDAQYHAGFRKQLEDLMEGEFLNYQSKFQEKKREEYWDKFFKCAELVLKGYRWFKF